ncbi:uridine kinase [Kineococcus rhizosphaerae]|uniref:Uridine kinase n=1 Tax=Kineococcus rhizosphaerae TaxID=559628 RepID=A0A2T0R443_9ACTN|nr:uridine kinase [Kineococcus rhizosphaerae]PRY15123.1 hypothetical protein CLV37_10549 [Kineococcus rhizosphaerae]
MGVDGAVDADTRWYAEHLVAALRALARPVLVADWRGFWRPRSLRFEFGRDDPDTYYDSWLDVPGVYRELLAPLGEPSGRRWVESLYDPQTDRASRAPRQDAPDDAVLVFAGSFLLKDDVRWGFDAVVHLTTSDAAIRRRVPAEDAARVLGGWNRYLAEDSPADAAAVVLRCEDPRHPAELLRE